MWQYIFYGQEGDYFTKSKHCKAFEYRTNNGEDSSDNVTHQPTNATMKRSTHLDREHLVDMPKIDLVTKAVRKGHQLSALAEGGGDGIKKAFHWVKNL